MLLVAGIDVSARSRDHLSSSTSGGACGKRLTVRLQRHELLEIRRCEKDLITLSSNYTKVQIT